MLFCFISYTDEISVKIGEVLKLDVLLPNADKVQHQSRGSTEWKEVWKRSGGVQSDLMTNTDGILIIRKFMADDAGTYRVLDFERNMLITVTVTVSGTESKGKLNYMDTDKPNDEISVEIGKQLKLDILLPNADKVEHQTEKSTGLMAVWSRSNVVWSDRLTNRDGNLIISEFAPSDAGTYIVLDSEGELLITLTVKASGSQRKHKGNTDKTAQREALRAFFK
ncbi:hypothetical protein ROHU_002392 [Labeo rohita]|uniref:Uncharacterized protein n=1 Tax=Labeo rohita TaxID=84645 RepID=A0A498NXS6_LABRO|nr:hypothetical protein ROHU_002392 [Labeo rohita]